MEALEEEVEEEEVEEYDDDEEEEEEDSEDEEEEEEENTLVSSAVKATTKRKIKESKKAVKEGLASKTSKNETKKTKKKSKFSLKIPYIIKTFLNPVTVFTMTKAYFGSLFTLDYFKEEDSSQNLRSALEEKAKKGGAPSRGRKKMKRGQAKTLSDLPQLNT